MDKKQLRADVDDAEAEALAAARRDEPRALRWGSGIALFLAGGALAAIALTALRSEDISEGLGVDPVGADVSAAAFSPPPLSAIPAGAEGATIRRAIAIFNDTGTNAAPYVGNGLACKNCHFDSGRKADAAPMWGGWVKFPVVDASSGAITTISDRIRGCFTNSMNAQDSPSGGPPPPGSPIYSDLQVYFAWLATGASVGATLPGSGFPPLAKPAQPHDPARGKAVFAQYCAGCHGPDGQGARKPDGTVVYPPLWGPHSYNWNAGMAMVDLAAAFIKANMPYKQAPEITTQQAWDVSAYINSRERPRDPMQKGSVEQTAKANFAGIDSYYGKTVDGRLLGAGTPGSGPFPKGQ